MKKTNLFDRFEPVSAKAFKQNIQVDLKGASYNDTLVWHTNEGIDVTPFYHRDTQKALSPIPGMPSQWHIGESIFILNASQSADTAIAAIEAGTEAIYFSAAVPFDYKVLLDTIDNGDIPLFISMNFLDTAFYKEVYAYAFAKAYNLTLKLDLIHHLVTDGNWFTTLEKDHQNFDTLLQTPNNSGVTIDMTIYQNAGATMIQQLGYGLAHLNEYLNRIEEKGGTLTKITFEVAVGTNYFFEIAKLRALRQMTAVLLQAYPFGAAVSSVDIIAHPTRRNKTIYDYNTNMLRTTTECMSAVLGGANMVVNMPYDALYHKTNDFGQRISRNQLIVLKKESYFDAVSNPSDGAYYIEEITHKLGTKGLALFKEIEKGGGFLKQLKAGVIQRKIKESADKEQAQFDTQEITLLGTNKHPNPNDRMKDEIELYPFVKVKPRKTIIAPIIPRRLAEKSEQERLTKEV
jgi:methylmalonyl-CoA mutase